MPTENRSSNTEMVSALMPCPFCGEKPQITKHHREDIYSFMHRCPVLGPISWGFREDQQAHIEKWNARAQPAPQPHPDPIAWMVGTAFWWTKEEAERDAAATGKAIVPFGPTVDNSEVERLRAVIVMEREGKEKALLSWQQAGNERENLRTQLAERDALLDRVVDHAKFWHDHPYAEVVEGIARDYKALSASAERNQCDACQAGIPLVNGTHRMGKPGQYADTMSCQAGRYASAEPSAPTHDPKLISIVHTPPAEYDEP